MYRQVCPLHKVVGESQAFFCPVLSFIPTSASLQQFRCALVYMLCTYFLPPRFNFLPQQCWLLPFDALGMLETEGHEYVRSTSVLSTSARPMAVSTLSMVLWTTTVCVSGRC